MLPNGKLKDKVQLNFQPAGNVISGVITVGLGTGIGAGVGVLLFLQETVKS